MLDALLSKAGWFCTSSISSSSLRHSLCCDQVYMGAIEHGHSVHPSLNASDVAGVAAEEDWVGSGSGYLPYDPFPKAGGGSKACFGPACFR